MGAVRERLLGQVGGRVVQRVLTGRAAAAAGELFPEVRVPRTQLSVPTRTAPVGVVAYTPPPAPGTGPPAVHVNFHGGGYVMGDPDQDDAICRCTAAWAGVVVLNVDYALAPQHPFPAAAHQAFDVVRWVHEHGAARGWDGDRISVGGQSAGGGLAAAAARQALEAGGPRITAQVLHYPPLDLVTDTATKRAGTPKAVISPGIAALFNAAYVPDPARRSDPLASPVCSTPDQLRGIAPALVITPELDRLRDEGARYAELLREAGALLGHHEVAGADHAYDLNGGEVEQVRGVYELIARTVADAAAGTAVPLPA